MNTYGVRETNPLTPDLKAMFLAEDVDVVSVDWRDERLDKIVRFRLLTDRGFPAYDVSYVWGVLKDGSPVRVSLPFSQLPKRTWKSTIIKHAQRDGVYAKGLGIFDNVSILSG